VWYCGEGSRWQGGWRRRREREKGILEGLECSHSIPWENTRVEALFTTRRSSFLTSYSPSIAIDGYRCSSLIYPFISFMLDKELF
jgi:hypothetical protein